MKIGLLVNMQFRAGTDMSARVPNMIEQVRTARESGFSSIWCSSSYLTAPMQMFQLSAVLPYLLAEAKGMTVGSDIIILPLQHPVAVAEEAATLDVLSGGNFVLGVGLGYRKEIFDSFGVPFSERAPRFVEGVGLIRRLWAEDRVTHEGKFYRISDAGTGIKPVQPEGIPIWVAAQVDAAIKRAAEVGDTWLIDPSMNLGQLGPAMKLYRDTLRELGKPDPADFPISRECFVGSTPAAIEEYRAALKFKYAAYSKWGLMGKGGEPTFDESFEQMTKDTFIIGDKASVKDQLAYYRDEIGVNHFIMRLQCPDLSHERVLDSIRALGEILA